MVAATQPQTSIHGNRFGLGVNNELFLQNPHTGGQHLAGAGLAGTYEGVRSELYDDFVGPVLSTFNWLVYKGSDGGAAFPAIAVANDGTVALTTSSGGASTMAVNGAQLNSSLNWKAVNGGLIFEARVNLSSLASTAAFIGFTNESTSLQMPANSAGSGNTITQTANDAVGFLFDTANTAQTFFLVGNAAGVAATPQVLANAPVASTYNVLRIELGTDGSAKFYIDGVMVGTVMTGAVTPTVALAPVFATFARTTAAKTLTVDYAFVSQLR